MIDYREIIRLKSLRFSNVAIANSLCCSRNTVSEVLKLAETHSLGWPIPDTLTNNDIEHLFYPGRGTNDGRRLPDYEYVYNELAKPGVTLSLLWAEYCAKCEAEHTIPYQHTQFNEKYHAYAASKKATLRIKRKPGETMEVDWIGDTLKVYDAASCCEIPAYIFVAVLPCSLYGYAEAFSATLSAVFPLSTTFPTTTRLTMTRTHRPPIIPNFFKGKDFLFVFEFPPPLTVCPTGLPQAGQNFAFVLISLPHLLQYIHIPLFFQSLSSAPHSEQKV